MKIGQKIDSVASDAPIFYIPRRGLVRKEIYMPVKYIVVKGFAA